MGQISTGVLVIFSPALTKRERIRILMYLTPEEQKEEIRRLLKVFLEENEQISSKGISSSSSDSKPPASKKGRKGHSGGRNAKVWIHKKRGTRVNGGVPLEEATYTPT